ncbi:MAG: helix-turn-helix domain-containing protein, partial [Marmoricola sp.]|nr:helix-turn-helix domain-containing protein [Marmoricola sp.]
MQSVDRAARLLRAVADAGADGASTVALGDACGLNRATAWRILSTLESHELVTN